VKKKPFSMHVDLDAFIPATDKEKEYMVQMRPSSTFFKDGVKRLLKNKIATISFIIIVILSLTSIFLPMFWPYGYDQMLGMDSIGRMDASYGNISPFRYGDTEMERILGTAKVHQVFLSTNKAYLEDVVFEEVKESAGLTAATAALDAAKAELKALKEEGSGATEAEIAFAEAKVDVYEALETAEKAVNSATNAENEIKALYDATAAAAKKAEDLGLKDDLSVNVNTVQGAISPVSDRKAEAIDARDKTLAAVNAFAVLTAESSAEDIKAAVTTVNAAAEMASAATKATKATIEEAETVSDKARQVVFAKEQKAVADEILAAFTAKNVSADNYKALGENLPEGAVYTYFDGVKHKEYELDTPVSDWLWKMGSFNSVKRSAGDTAVIETANGCFVLCFEGYKGGGEKIFPHVFGTDAHGRDYFIRIVYGMRVSLAVGLFASIIVLVIGMLIGSISGYLGGKVDLIIMRIVDIIYSLPDMLMVILLASVLKLVLGDVIEGTVFEKIGSNIISLFIVFGLLYWVSMSRLIRGQILSLREQEYVLSAKCSGAGSGRIIKKHLVPNCISVIIISTALQIPSAIFTESYLSFLGLGVNAPMPSLGSLASDALNGYASYPHRLIFPAVVISLIVLSLNLFGDGLRDAFDPKLNK